MNAPSVTVLLPVFNGAAHLRASIESILRQAFADFELLVVDDGSSDDTPEILRAIADPRLRVLRNERNIGLMRTLNRGLREARGALVARQDSDDLSQPFRLARQVAFLDSNPAMAMLGGSCWRMDSAGRITGTNDLPITHTALRWASVLDNPFIHSTVMFRRDIVLGEFGGYDESCAICEDYELWNRIAARHMVANLPERLVFYREHATSMMQSQPEAAARAMQRLVSANLATIFPGAQFSCVEIELLSLFRLRFEHTQLASLLALIERLRAEFLQRHPDAASSADFRATLCRQHLRLAYKFLGSERGIAAGQIARAFRESPREWLRQGWFTVSCAAGFTPALP